jgi:hypothetical protein
MKKVKEKEKGNGTQQNSTRDKNKTAGFENDFPNSSLDGMLQHSQRALMIRSIFWFILWAMTTTN